MQSQPAQAPPGKNEPPHPGDRSHVPPPWIVEPCPSTLRQSRPIGSRGVQWYRCRRSRSYTIGRTFCRGRTLVRRGPRRPVIDGAPGCSRGRRKDVACRRSDDARIADEFAVLASPGMRCRERARPERRAGLNRASQAACGRAPARAVRPFPGAGRDRPARSDLRPSQAASAHRVRLGQGLGAENVFDVHAASTALTSTGFTFVNASWRL